MAEDFHGALSNREASPLCSPALQCTSVSHVSFILATSPVNSSTANRSASPSVGGRLCSRRNFLAQRESQRGALSSGIVANSTAALPGWYGSSIKPDDPMMPADRIARMQYQNVLTGILYARQRYLHDLFQRNAWTRRVSRSRFKCRTVSAPAGARAPPTVRRRFDIHRIGKAKQPPPTT